MRLITRSKAVQQRRGSIMATTLVLMTLAAVGTILMANTVMDHQRLNERRRDLWRAFNHAEAGIAQVQHWGMYPSEFSTDQTMFVETVIEVDTTGVVTSDITFQSRFPGLYAAINASSSGYIISESMLAGMNVGQFTSTYGHNMGSIQQIELLPPAGTDPIACDFKIRSTGTTPEGISKTILAYMELNSAITIKIPAALISFNTIGTNGNGKVHWGESWAKTNIQTNNRNHYDYLSSDPNAIWRTEGLIDTWGNNVVTGPGTYGGWKVDTATNPDINIANMYPLDMGNGIYDSHFYQSVPSSVFDSLGGWPEFDYATLKALAQAHGRYYSTDAAGNIYKDGVETAANQIDFLSEFGVEDHSTAPNDLVFIDTIDGNPPAADGSNLASISVNGSNSGLKGIFYVGAHFNGTGLNQGADGVVMESPYGTQVDNVSLFLNGVLYAAGICELAGGTNVYGSIITQMGFGGSGTPDIYYNQDLANGLIIGNGNIGSPFRVALHNSKGE